MRFDLTLSSNWSIEKQTSIIFQSNSFIYPDKYTTAYCDSIMLR